jgi:hypothetical protein
MVNKTSYLIGKKKLFVTFYNFKSIVDMYENNYIKNVIIPFRDQKSFWNISI